MGFKEFEKEIWEKGYGITAMNHYMVSGKRHTYCVVLSKDKQRAFQFEAENSEEVFKSIYNQLINFEKKTLD